MKKIVIAFILLGTIRARAQAFEIEQLALDISKLAQLKTILSDLYRGYEILNTGYSAVRNISEGNFNLHQAFLDALLVVSPAIKNYVRVADIINYQERIMSEYRTAHNQFSQNKHFNPDEITYLGHVYDNLLSGSLSNLSNLLNIITAGKLRMSDDERLHAIDAIYTDTRDELMFLRKFNNDTQTIAIQRARELNEIGTVQGLYGRKPNSSP